MTTIDEINNCFVENKEIEAPDEVLRSGMAQCSKWVEGEKHRRPNTVV